MNHPDEVVLYAAQEIEDIVWMSHAGGRAQFLAQVQGVGETVTLSASAAELTAYLSGRDPSLGPALPAWL